jgi:lipid-A-disaccharide synthase
MSHINYQPPIFICAGEPSGDLYAALIVKRLEEKLPRKKIYGVGGEQMSRAGVEVIETYDKLMTFGFSTGILSMFRNYKIYRKITQSLYVLKPKTFIAVAYPGINLLLSRYAKRLGCKVYYFLPPQIWAWGTFRKYFIEKWVDNVISFFPFEYEFYKAKGIKVDYMENPLRGELKDYERNDFKKRVGFMPGSRRNEIKRNFSIMIELMNKINQEKAEIEFFLIVHSNFLELLKSVVARSETPRLDCLKIITEDRYQAMKNCDLLIVSSGTASLEAAIMGIPQVFFNHPSFFDYYVMRHFLKLKEYNLANLYFNRNIVPSFVSRNKRDVLQKLFELIDDHICLVE